MDLTPDQLRGIQLALADVVSRGTAAGAQIRGLTIAGKTGTAQVDGQQDNAWFVGYAPADAPKIVVAIIIEEGLHGSSAATVATKLMERYLKTKLTMTAVTND
jgi:cell division protein FtsI/penicillin-binding protein 2